MKAILSVLLQHGKFQLPGCDSTDLRICQLSSLIETNFYLVFKRFYLFIFRERGREGEREGEKHQCVVASHVPLTRDLARNPGMCPGWESNQ